MDDQTNGAGAQQGGLGSKAVILGLGTGEPLLDCEYLDVRIVVAGAVLWGVDSGRG